MASAPNVKINLTDGNYLSRVDHEYLAAGAPDRECASRCPDWPHYLCSRDKNHRDDHAAHGWRQGLKRVMIVMYARWSQ